MGRINDEVYPFFVEIGSKPINTSEATASNRSGQFGWIAGTPGKRGNGIDGQPCEGRCKCRSLGRSAENEYLGVRRAQGYSHCDQLR